MISAVLAIWLLPMVSVVMLFLKGRTMFAAIYGVALN